MELQCHCDIQANTGLRALQHKAKSATPEPAAPMASIRGGAAATSRPLKATSRENRRSGAQREAEAAELARVPQWPRQMVQPESNRGPGASFRPRVRIWCLFPQLAPGIPSVRRSGGERQGALHYAGGIGRSSNTQAPPAPVLRILHSPARQRGGMRLAIWISLDAFAAAVSRTERERERGGERGR